MADEPRKPIVSLPVGRVIGPLQERIRKIAAETKRVFISRHAEERMWERDISTMEVFEVLRLGMIDGAPWLEPEGDQACKVVFRRKGSRAIGVVTILLIEEELLVKTVEWEDER